MGNWLLQIRGENLTSVINSLSFITSPTFYFSIIAVGYWLRPGGRIFVHLGFLVPFATLWSLILKNLFAVMRPDHELHLIKVHDMLGFPSSEVQVAMVFWGVVSLRAKNSLITSLCVLILLCIMFSQLYLGIQTVPDVLAGLFFGGITVLLFYSPLVQNMVESWFASRSINYWVLFSGSVASYIFVLENNGNIYNPLFIIAVSALTGYGLSLPNIAAWQNIPEIFSAKHCVIVAVSFIMIILLMEAIPTIYSNDTTAAISSFMEYTLIVFMIYSVFPRLHKFVLRNQ